ncbi:MAG: ABC transporter permease subunit [Lachnospiraceae bacterium]|nr:ABC transporter permease subunit [Lachnospiraceae bacterium]
MTLLKHELRQGRSALCIWTAIIASMTALCVLIYPEIRDQMSAVSGMFSDMGVFSAAFGMDKLNFGEFLGFFGVECGNILGLGGSFFAALLGAQALAKEEKDGTAEFLLTHPISRSRILLQKLSALFLQIALLNLVVIGVVLLSVTAIGERPDPGTFPLLFLAYFLLQLETAAVCFGFSAFIRNGGASVGLGTAALFYFLNIVANLTKKAGFLKYVTPFGYAESADIITDRAINGRYLAVGMGLAVLGIAAAFLRYRRKDVR